MLLEAPLVMLLFYWPFLPGYSALGFDPKAEPFNRCPSCSSTNSIKAQNLHRSSHFVYMIKFYSLNIFHLMDNINYLLL